MVANAIIDIKPTALSVVETSPEVVRKQIEKIRLLQATIKEVLVKDVDYGTIPGCGDKPTLFKSGAEKVLITFSLQSEYELVQNTENFDGKGFFSYTVKSLIFANGIKITEGLGHANSKETKFAYKWVAKNKLPHDLNPELLPSRKKTGSYGEYWEYRVEEDMNSKANTILKMAKKRAQVDAVLTVANLSELFTQDFDDLLDGDQETPQDKVNNLKEQIKNKEATTTTASVCSVCNKSIPEPTFKFSQEKFGKPLCYTCQQKEKAKLAKVKKNPPTTGDATASVNDAGG